MNREPSAAASPRRRTRNPGSQRAWILVIVAAAVARWHRGWHRRWLPGWLTRWHREWMPPSIAYPGAGAGTGAGILLPTPSSFGRQHRVRKPGPERIFAVSRRPLGDQAGPLADGDGAPVARNRLPRRPRAGRRRARRYSGVEGGPTWCQRSDPAIASRARRHPLRARGTVGGTSHGGISQVRAIAVQFARLRQAGGPPIQWAAPSGATLGAGPQRPTAQCDARNLSGRTKSAWASAGPHAAPGTISGQGEPAAGTGTVRARGRCLA
jgi:hypothetical protein